MYETLFSTQQKYVNPMHDKSVKHGFSFFLLN